MKALRVNADYELELFYSRNGPAIMNESLEFLAFFLSERPVLTKKCYPEDYLQYVEKLSGHRPRTVIDGEFENWWGPLENKEHERWMNSKLTSTELNMKEGWLPGASVIRSEGDIAALTLDGEFLLKDPFGMSGQGIRRIKDKIELPLNGPFPLILEPAQRRIWDFSHYIYPDGTTIAYENFVDQRCQYRGTLFRNLHRPEVSSFGGFSAVSVEEWRKLEEALKIIKSHYLRGPLATGLSIDSFVFQGDGKLEIRSICEVNYRRTMGSTAFELARRYGQGQWSLLTLAKVPLESSEIRERLRGLSGVILLSPSGVRYQMFLLSARDEATGLGLLRELRKLLPEGELSVNL